MHFPILHRRIFRLARFPPSVSIPRDRTPYVQQWNMSINQTLGSNMLAEVSYAGSKGTKLAERVNINQAVLPDPSNITPIVTRRPFPSFGDILSANWQENSNYNALQTRLERRFSGNLSFLIGYTWSKAIERHRVGAVASWHQSAYRLRDDRGNSDFDVRSG